jgi:uncharacterized protein YjiS (DUF1127 family)
MISESRAWRSIRARAKRAIGWPFRVAAARATLRALAKMDRRELADIGLNPSDLRDASALPLDRDPTELLARRARERRRDAFAAERLGRDERPDQDWRDSAGRNWPPPRPDRALRARLIRTGLAARRRRSP